MNTLTKIISIEKLRPHPYHQEVYESNPTDALKVSFLRTGNKPVYPIVVVPHLEDPELFLGDLRDVPSGNIDPDGTNRGRGYSL